MLTKSGKSIGTTSEPSNTGAPRSNPQVHMAGRSRLPLPNTCRAKRGHEPCWKTKGMAHSTRPYAGEEQQGEDEPLMENAHWATALAGEGSNAPYCNSSRKN